MERELSTTKEQLELLLSLQGEEGSAALSHAGIPVPTPPPPEMVAELKVARTEIESLKEMLQLQRQLLHDKAKANAIR